MQSTLKREEALALIRRGNVPKDTNLRGLDLTGADLRRARISCGQLAATNLHYADLRGADFNSSELQQADLSRVRAQGVCLAYVRAADANMRQADLQNALLMGADLSGVDLTDADLTGADCRHARFRGARLTRTNLSKADLSGADLSGADMRHARLWQTELRTMWLPAPTMMLLARWVSVPRTDTELHADLLAYSEANYGCPEVFAEWAAGKRQSLYEGPLHQYQEDPVVVFDCPDRNAWQPGRPSPSARNLMDRLIHVMHAERLAAKCR